MIPSLKEWDEKYRSQGLVIIGNHYPEFSFEEDLTNLQAAVAENGIKYAVAQDNDGATWKAYKNRYWPTLYLIDKMDTFAMSILAKEDMTKLKQLFKVYWLNNIRGDTP